VKEGEVKENTNVDEVAIAILSASKRKFLDFVELPHLFVNVLEYS